MRRRTFLSTAAGALVAGCLSGNRGGSDRAAKTRNVTIDPPKISKSSTETTTETSTNTSSSTITETPTTTATPTGTATASSCDGEIPGEAIDIVDIDGPGSVPKGGIYEATITFRNITYCHGTFLSPLMMSVQGADTHSLDQAVYVEFTGRGSATWTMDKVSLSAEGPHTFYPKDAPTQTWTVK